MRALDLCCGPGGASVGYDKAGFEVKGVDISPQPRYPFSFLQEDALETLIIRKHWIRANFDLVHVSPPCPGYSALNAVNRKQYPQLIEPFRAKLLELGIPFVIENVNGAPLRRDLVLCGEMFGLGVIRHRVFEVHGFRVSQPAHKPHRGRVRGWRHGKWFDGPYVAVYGNGGGKGTVAEWQQAMGIDWTDDRAELKDAIPPAYTQEIGRQFLGKPLTRYHEAA